MMSIREHAQEYVAMRRKLGFKLTKTDLYLTSFVAYLEQHGMTTLTTQAALAWATETAHSVDPANWARRLMPVRIFARHLRTLEPATEIPPADMLPRSSTRSTPYLFASGDVDALLAAANRLRTPFRALTYRTLFGLLAVTGMRIAEALHLDRDDVDLETGILTIVDSKFGKSRQVPVHDSTVAALADYGRRRDERPRAQTSTAFLISDSGTRLHPRTTTETFARLITAAGIKAPVGQRRPRQHDLRHSFATATLLEWYRDGVDVQARLPLLSTYLGHADPRATYWYLSGSPELLAIAAQHLEGSFGGQP